MANIKISGLDPLGADVADDDLIEIVDVSDTPSPGVSKSAKASELVNATRVKTAYENNSNTNAFTDAEQSKLTGIADNANNYSHPNHTGDVTSVNDSATTIAAGVVTLAKMAAMATASFLGRNTGGSGDPEVLSATTARSILNVADGANNYTHPNHTGDVTSTGDGATVIADNVVGLDQMAHGTDGELITYDATGAPAKVATGTADQVLTSNGPGAEPTFQAAGGGGGGLQSMQVFTASGTWTKPAGINIVKVTVVGGGGAGGSGGSKGGHGGGGGAAIEVIDVSAISSETVTVGAGGLDGGANPNPGNPGGTSSFGAHCSATGGAGGTGDGGGPGAGGAGSGGDINLSGHNNGDSSMGFGGKGSSVDGVLYGGGGDGGSLAVGGDGKAGIVIVEEYK